MSKVFLITGAGRGMGVELARAALSAGHRVVATGRRPDAVATAVGSDPVDVGGGLFAQQVQAQEELERNWSTVQGWLGRALVERGVDRIAAEELSVPPGGDELFSLLAIKAHWESGDWDAIVVDCAPTGETLRLLSFPDVARWWLDKVFGRETQLLAAARPLARAYEVRATATDLAGNTASATASIEIRRK